MLTVTPEVTTASSTIAPFESVAPVSDAPDLDNEAGRENFVYCITHLTEVDVLNLAAGGHRRAVAALGPAGVGDAVWVGP